MAVCSADLREALPVLMRHRKPLALSAELESDGDETCGSDCDSSSHATWAATRPPRFEVAAAEAVVAALFHTKRQHEVLWANATAAGSAFGVHILHLSSVEALPVYQRVRPAAALWHQVPVVQFLVIYCARSPRNAFLAGACPCLPRLSRFGAAPLLPVLPTTLQHACNPPQSCMRRDSELPRVQAQAEGLPITIDTAPHYLTFSDAAIAAGDTRLKAAPPIRGLENRAALRAAAGAGAAAAVASAHTPVMLVQRKGATGDFLAAWPGISGLQYMLPAVNTVARVCPLSDSFMRSPNPGTCVSSSVSLTSVCLCIPLLLSPTESVRHQWLRVVVAAAAVPEVGTGARVQEEGWTFDVMAKLLSEGPARVAGLSHRKGRLAAGLDADLVIWHPFAATNTSEAAYLHRQPGSPYVGLELQGSVQYTMVQGAVVYSAEEGVYKRRLCGSAVLEKSTASL